MQRTRDNRRARQSCALKKEQEANYSCGQTTENHGARAAARQQEAQHHRRQHGSRELVRADARQRGLIGPTPLIGVAPALRCRPCWNCEPRSPATAGLTRYERHCYLLRGSFGLPLSGKVVPGSTFASALRPHKDRSSVEVSALSAMLVDICSTGIAKA